MAAASETVRTIAKLTPLADVLALIDRDVTPVEASTMPLAAAAGRVVAADVASPSLPGEATALIDGWALTAEATRDAGGYAPAPLPRLPTRVAPGDPMPLGTDCVAPFDAVAITGDRAEALAAVDAGDGVLPRGGDSDPSTPLRRAGERLRAADIAVLTCAGITEVKVRAPRIRVVALQSSGRVLAAARLIGSDIEARGGGVTPVESANDPDKLFRGGDDLHFLVVIGGGTGSGRADNSVTMLARAGRVAAHGIALTPGETAAFGFAGSQPVLLLPDRFDAALAVWLLLGRRMLHRLDGGSVFEESSTTSTLSRKVASTVGLDEFVLVRRAGDQVEPLAAKYLPLSALARADGWILVPPDSEGYSPGARVSVRPLP